MKKGKIVLIIVAIMSYIMVVIFMKNPKKVEKKNLEVTASINTVYVMALNITKDVPNIEVNNLTAKVVGCPHDYQLTPKNVEDIMKSDAFLINGFGMETYLQNLMDKKVNIVDISSSFETEEDKKVEEHDHEHEVNGHVWLDIDKYEEQVKNVANEIIKIDKANESKYIFNRDEYLKKLDEVKEKQSKLNKLSGTKTVIFHNSSELLLEKLNVEVVAEVDIESEAGVSANEVKNVIQKIKDENIKYVVTDPAYNQDVVKQIQKETGVKICNIDSLINLNTEENVYDSYINGMKNNLKNLDEIC